MDHPCKVLTNYRSAILWSVEDHFVYTFNETSYLCKMSNTEVKQCFMYFSMIN